MNPTRTQAIATFLKHVGQPDLASMYSHDMECQVNVLQGDGKLKTGEYRGREYFAYTDGFTEWKAFRIPYNADTEPEYSDIPMSFDLAKHCESIGMTGWDWKNKVSRWVAFDFDAMTGHSDKHTAKLTEDQLREVEDIVSNIPWATIRSSKSGRGRHVYVLLNPVPTSNHHEHAAVARAILSQMSGLTGYDFASKVDICGGNMWIWHKQTGPEGLKLIKQGTILDSVPPNWKDHYKVVTKKSQKVLPQFVSELNSNDPENLFLEITGQRSRIPLDKEHRALINFLTETRARWWWDNDHWMLVTHTSHLMEAQHKLKLKGNFTTAAIGSNQGHDHNCFAFPMRMGAWSVRRYGEGVLESDTWERDSKGWTRCFFNKPLDLRTLSRLQQGIEHQKGGFIFNTFLEAKKVLEKLGIDTEVDANHSKCETWIRPIRGDNKLAVSITAPKDARKTDLPNWHLEKGYFTRVFTSFTTENKEGDQKENFDDLIRHLVSDSEKSSDLGWVIKADGEWREEPLAHVKAVLRAQELSPKEIEMTIGNCIQQAWKIVNRPFQPEYPGNRQWNQLGARFRYTPSVSSDGLYYPTWNKILEHLGQGINLGIQDTPWCAQVGITSGADYLRLWIASLFQHPEKPLPYLAFWSDQQNTGKSIFHEAISEILMLRGSMSAVAALKSDQGFNAELENAILCIIEEIDLSKNKGDIYNRIKDWVTSDQIPCHKKFGTPYMVKNYTHWIQCTNNQPSIPIFPGDTRITLIPVYPLKEIIPKEEMKKMLHKEAADFLKCLLMVDIPKSNDRLNLPVIETGDKKAAGEGTMNKLEEFLQKECYEIPGSIISVADFYTRLAEWLDPAELANYSKNKLGKIMPARFPKGRTTSNPNMFYGNISFSPNTPPGQRLALDGHGFLRKIKE